MTIFFLTTHCHDSCSLKITYLTFQRYQSSTDVRLQMQNKTNLGPLRRLLTILICFSCFPLWVSCLMFPLSYFLFWFQYHLCKPWYLLSGCLRFKFHSLYFKFEPFSFPFTLNDSLIIPILVVKQSSFLFDLLFTMWPLQYDYDRKHPPYRGACWECSETGPVNFLDDRFWRTLWTHLHS